MVLFQNKSRVSENEYNGLCIQRQRAMNTTITLHVLTQYN